MERSRQENSRATQVIDNLLCSFFCTYLSSINSDFWVCGDSYGLEIPVKLGNSPALALHTVL